MRATVFTGLAGIIAGCLALALLPAESGVAGYAIPLIWYSPQAIPFSKRLTTQR